MKQSEERQPWYEAIRGSEYAKRPKPDMSSAQPAAITTAGVFVGGISAPQNTRGISSSDGEKNREA